MAPVPEVRSELTAPAAVRFMPSMLLKLNGTGVNCGTG
jgi:hypothetical protein